MEPTNLTLPSDDARLESWLRQSAPAPLPDAGFSARVLRTLPPSRHRVDCRRLVLCAIAAAAAIVLFTPSPDQIWTQLTHIIPNLSQNLSSHLAKISWPKLWPSLLGLFIALTTYLWTAHESKSCSWHD